jgi:hypothetical protein
LNGLSELEQDIHIIYPHPCTKKPVAFRELFHDRLEGGTAIERGIAEIFELW